MTCRIAVLTFLAVAVAFCRSSRADEDGSFCTSKRGIYVADEITLQDFQVHRMACGQDRVEISGWARVFKKYTIDIAGEEKLRVVDYTEDSTRRFDPSKDGPEAPKFAYTPPGLIALESLDPHHKYTLMLSALEKNVEGGVEHHSKAELRIA